MPAASSDDILLTASNNVKVLTEAARFLASCGSFNASKFATLDNILSRASVSFGPGKRQQMVAKCRGDMEVLRQELALSIGQSLKQQTEIAAKLAGLKGCRFDKALIVVGGVQ